MVAVGDAAAAYGEIHNEFAKETAALSVGSSGGSSAASSLNFEPPDFTLRFCSPQISAVDQIGKPIDV